MLMWAMSDRAIPRSFRFMEGFGVHTFRLVNAAGRSTFVKFHWKPKLGLQSVVWNEAVKINGADPDFHRRDLWDAIQSGDFPEWELGLQVFDDDFADALRLRRPRPDQAHPRGGRADPARRPPRARPRRRQLLRRDRAGRVLHAEHRRRASTSRTTRCCRAATSPTSTRSSSGSGARTSPTCRSTRRSARSRRFQQDGHMATREPGQAARTTSRTRGRRRRRAARGRRRAASSRSRPRRAGEKRRLRAESFADHYSQARQFYVSQTPVEQQHIADAFVFELSKVERLDIRERMVANLRNVDDGPRAAGRRPARPAAAARAQRAGRARRSPTSRPRPR